MKTKFASSALILVSGLIAGTSFAADTGALSREQVRAAYLQARADGSLAQGEGQLAAVQSTPSTLTRAAVQAEYLAASKAGTLPVASEGQVFKVEPAASTLTREAVRAEYMAAKKAGALPKTGGAS